MSYTRIYNVGIMDDLHNYFPAILYEPERFRHVGELLSYVRDQAYDRFNLFNAGARDYRRNHYPVQTPPPFIPQPTWRMPPRTGPLPMPVPITMPLPSQQDEEQLNQLLHQMIHGLMGHQIIPTNLESVVVRPTPQQIATATSISTSQVEERACAICQDNIELGSEIRTLNRCEHAFHTGCIDTWFRTNVRCPVCRHDIRQQAA